MAECNKNKNCVRKRATEFGQQEYNSISFMESLSDNRLKKNHITGDMKYFVLEPA